MKMNLGSLDRIVRLILAAIIGILFFSNVVTGTFGIILMVIAAIFVLTSLMGFCPLYALFRLNTTSLHDSQ